MGEVSGSMLRATTNLFTFGGKGAKSLQIYIYIDVDS